MSLTSDFVLMVGAPGTLFSGGSFVVGAGWVQPLAALQATGDLSFSLTEIAVISALLLATTGALSFVFKRYVDSEKNTNAQLREQVDYLRGQAAMAVAGQADINKQTLEIVRGVISTNQTTMDSVVESMREVERSNRDRMRAATEEHREQVQTIRDIAVILRGRRAGDGHEQELQT